MLNFKFSFIKQINNTDNKKLPYPVEDIVNIKSMPKRLNKTFHFLNNASSKEHNTLHPPKKLNKMMVL